MIKAIGDRIIVLTLEMEKKTRSGIILSDTTTNQDVAKARVITVSDNITEKISIGDIVYFSKFKGESIKYDEVEYIVLETKDILAKEIISE